MSTNVKTTTTTKKTSSGPVKSPSGGGGKKILSEEIITTKKKKKVEKPVVLPEIPRPQPIVKREVVQPQILLPPLRTDKNYEERYRRVKYLRKLREDRMLRSLEKQTGLLEDLAEEYRERNEDEVEDLRDEIEDLENENRELRLEKKYENRVQDQTLQYITLLRRVYGQYAFLFNPL